MQWLARLPGTQEIRGSSPGRGMTDFCTSIFICIYIYIKESWKYYNKSHFDFFLECFQFNNIFKNKRFVNNMVTLSRVTT